ncbi:hypothetical protein ACOME3_006044 [Neoechinorhynchus agilis]
MDYLLRFEDHINGTDTYMKVVKIALTIYLSLKEKLDNESRFTDELVNDENMSAAEQRKLERKKKKAVLKQQQQSNSGSLIPPNPPKSSSDTYDMDEHGRFTNTQNPFELEQTKQPLKDAEVFVVGKDLLNCCSMDTELCWLLFRFHLARQKFLLAYKCIYRLKHCFKHYSTDSYHLHDCIVRFLLMACDDHVSQTDQLTSFLLKIKSDLMVDEGIDHCTVDALLTYNEKYLKQSDSVQRTFFSCLITRQWLLNQNNGQSDENKESLIDLLDQDTLWSRDQKANLLCTQSNS